MTDKIISEENNMKAKIVNMSDTGRGEGEYALVMESGEILFTHYCSSADFAYGDLYGDNPKRQKLLKDCYGITEVERA